MANRSILRFAIPIVAASAVSAVITCYINLYDSPKRKRNSKDPNEKPSQDDTFVTKEESDDDTRATAISDESAIHSETDLPPTELETGAGAIDPCSLPALLLRSFSTSKIAQSVVLRSDQGHQIEGTISANENLINPDVAINALCKVDDATALFTFATVLEGTGWDSSSTSNHSVKVEEIAMPSLSSVTRRNDDGLESNMIENTKETKQQENPASVSIRHHRKNMTSEAIIMISPEDLAMVHDLLLQMEDDDALFDCSELRGGRRCSWRKR